MAESLEQVKPDGENLYREETYTDLRAGSIRKLQPVTADGADDPSRSPMFTAVAQIMTPGGVLPLSGEIAGAKTLREAVEGFPGAVKAALEDLRAEMEAIQRERASQIVVPGRDVPPVGGIGGIAGASTAGGSSGGGGLIL
jgi:hypothetical protein